MSSKQQVLCHREGKINIDIILIVMISFINDIIYVTVNIRTLFPRERLCKLHYRQHPHFKIKMIIVLLLTLIDVIMAEI